MSRTKKIAEQEFFPITESLLKKLAGAAAFTKGKDYFQTGAVVDIKTTGNKIIAEVQGSEIYTDTLDHNEQSLSGACDCPASEGIDFCKHCVAVALVRANQFIEEKESKTKPEKKLSEPEKRRKVFREYFATLSQESLLDTLVDIIDTDKALRQQWQLKAQQSRLLSAADIRKIITSSIPLNRNLYRSSEVNNYFLKVEELIDFLVEKINPAAKESLALVEYTYDRIMDALEAIDDSGGYRYKSIEKLQGLYFKTLEQKQMKPTALAEYVFSLWSRPYLDILPQVPNDFLHLFNEEAKTHFLLMVKKEWESQSPTKHDKYGFGSYNYRRSVLESVLLDEAYEQKNVDDIIAIKSKFANCAKDYLAVSQVCLELGKQDIAREWLEKARSEKGKQYIQFGALERTEVNILLQEKKPQAAVDILWSLYQKSPAVECLDAMVDISQKAKLANNWLEHAVDFHQQVLKRPQKNHEQLTHVNALVSLNLRLNQPEEARIVCSKYETEANLLLKVAACFKAEPEKSVPLVRRVILAVLQQYNLNNQTYLRVVDLMKRIKEYADTGKQPKFFTDILQEIRTTYKAKRNLISYIQQAFGE